MNVETVSLAPIRKPCLSSQHAKLVQSRNKAVLAYPIDDKQCLMVVFDACHACMFGKDDPHSSLTADMFPTDGQPFRVQPSPWTRGLKHMSVFNSDHVSGNFDDYHHFVIPFTDAVFECLALDYSAEILRTTMEEVYLKMMDLVSHKSQSSIMYEKLVRDLIPDIIKKDGKGYRIKHLRGDAFRQGLANKLVEEAKEFQESRSMEELADVLEVMEAIIAHEAYSLADVEIAKEAKRVKRGGFKHGIHLIDVMEVNE